jgi:hypothetical protein
MTLSTTQAGWIQAATIIGTLLVLHVPLGDYIARVLGPSSPAEGARHRRGERLVYRLGGIDPDTEQNWRQYLRCILALSAAGILLLYLLLRIQARLPYSQGHGGLSQRWPGTPRSPSRPTPAGRTTPARPPPDTWAATAPRCSHRPPSPRC